MKMKIIRSGQSAHQTLQITHESDTQSQFRDNANEYGKRIFPIDGTLDWVWGVGDKFSNFEYDVLATINGYWASLDMPTQDEIFRIYCRIKEEFNDAPSINYLTNTLRPLVAELVSYHPLDRIKYWAETRGDLVVPSGIPQIFDTGNSTSWTQERTYVAGDYRELIPLAIASKALFPVWEEYLNKTKSEAGEIWKDWQAFHLISSSTMIDCPAMRRLAMFVNHVIPKDRSPDAAILQGVTIEDFPTWVLSHIVVKRLCTGDIRGTDESTTLISYLYNNVISRARHLDGKIPKIKPKNATDSSGGSDEDNNLSKLEGFKIRQELPAGDIETMAEYVRRSVEQIRGKRPLVLFSLPNRLSMDDDFLPIARQCLDNCTALEQARLGKAQVTIAGWVLASYIPIRAIPHLRKEHVVNMMAMAQAYLWKYGHYDLAALVGATQQYNYESDSLVVADKRRGMDKDVLEDIAKRFPFQPKQKSSRALNKNVSNKALAAINDVVEELSSSSWVLNMPEAWIVKVKRNAADRRYVAHEDIRTKLGQLIVELDNRAANKPDISALYQVKAAI